MDSSTLPSKRWLPKNAAALVLIALAAWGICVLYTLEWNPNIRYFVQGGLIKDRWADKMTREHGEKIVIYGGSSCAFSIDGERMLNRFGLPTVNYGREADFGATVLTESVLGQVRPGDTLIVATEPQLLCEPLAPPAIGVQFGVAMHHPEWLIHPLLGEPSVNWFQTVAALRPGGYLTFTYLGKIAMGKPLMRYHVTDYRASGFEQTAVRLKVVGPAGNWPLLSADGCRLLRNLRAWCEQRHVRLAYSLPWSYCPPAKEREFKKNNIDFLLQVNEYIPVLKDSYLGANTNADFFADTLWHLTEPGSNLRTDTLAQSLKDWSLWTPVELRARASQL
jgi:hypothetical protein